MEKAALKLRKNIMRRVYFVYGLRTLSNPLATHGAVLLVSIFLMTYFVSFKDVFMNIMHVEVVQVLPYIFGSILNTEVWTLVLLGVAIFSVLTLRIRLHIPTLAKA